MEGFELYMTASIGISTFSSDGTMVEEMIKNTDAALYRAKVSRKNNYQIYSWNELYVHSKY
ncbi:diguanylate cyclase domain-containing protein [Bacillus sp. V3B]|uniref:diguanylate cyclase domain-containing protein n=1 Tax=Bacillus sp. V3B TaxID=2804915 RepID=UPI00210DB04D|nr:diguanylate cyclase [Bacillus sp. V3B]